MNQQQKNQIDQDLGLKKIDTGESPFTAALLDHIENKKPVLVINADLDNRAYRTSVFKHQYNSIPEIGEVNRKPSMTVPDQTLSIPELIKRSQQGIPLADSRTPLYDGEDDLLAGIDIRRLDLSERYELMRANAEELIEIRKEIKQKQDEDTRKKFEDDVRKKIKMEADNTTIPKTQTDHSNISNDPSNISKT